MKYCNDKQDIPKGEHYAVLVFGSIHIPGDERSRTAPGHGYPEHTETKIDYIAFDSRVECESWIERSERYGKPNFQIVVATPCAVNRTTTVEISK